jgi:N-sulfoglucosamine sulfohydrolase
MFRATLLVQLFVCGLLTSLSAAPPPLNLLLIIADDLSHPDTSLYGGQAATPHMEQLAAEGMLFTRTFQSAPMCSPTRHALYTSLHPVKSGAWPNHTFVYDGVRSIAHYLKDQGYRAALSGKTHINPIESFPFEYIQSPKKTNNPYFPGVDKFLGECASQQTPFGLILTSNEPHTPWNKGDASAYPPAVLQLPPPLVDTPATRENYSRYLAEITYFDSQVGEALAALEKHGLADNTLVIVLTEQGNSFPFAKWTCYDVGLGSGMVVRWPGVTAPHSTSDALIEYIDILPTFFESAGLPIPSDLDGRSFRSVLAGQTKTHKEVVFGLQTSNGVIAAPPYYGIRTARDERFRYIRNLTPEVAFTNGVMRSDFWAEWEAEAAAGDPDASVAVRRYQHRPAEELYDCRNDPWNRHNLIDDPAFAAIKTRLSAALDAWMTDQGDLGQATELAAAERLWKNRDE